MFDGHSGITRRLWRIKLPNRCQSACTDQTVQLCTKLATVIAPEEDVVFLTKAGGSQRALTGIVIRFCKTVIAVVAQSIPLVQNISERLAQPGFLRQSSAFLRQQVMQRYQQRLISGRLAASRSVAGGRVFPLTPCTVHRYVSGLPLPSLSEVLSLWRWEISPAGH